MRSVCCEIALAELHNLGFNAVITEDGGLSIQNFKLYAEKELFKVEGDPVPNSENRKDNFYHNYTYPDGIICGWDKILIEKIIIQGEFSNYSRIQAFTLPRDILPKESADIDNLSFMVSFICNKDPGAIPVNVVNENVRINLDGHSTYAPQVLDYLIGLITQEARQYDSEINYISDTGRLIPIVIPYLKLELRKHLLTEKGDIGLLEILRDRDVNTSHSTIDLKLPPLLVKTYIDKICRNDGKLVSIVDRLLKVTQMPNFIATDLNGLKTQEKKNIIEHHKKNKTPLYMSTTTGGHAFAMMLDFANNQLFLANPAGPSDFDEIITHVQKISGCNTVVWANTCPLERSGNIDIDDTCTADSYALVHMMRTHPGLLSHGCLNSESLKTGDYVLESLNKERLSSDISYSAQGGGAASINNISPMVSADASGGRLVPQASSAATLNHIQGHSSSSASARSYALSQDSFEKALGDISDAYATFQFMLTNLYDRAVVTEQTVRERFQSVVQDGLDKINSEYPGQQNVIKNRLIGLHQEFVKNPYLTAPAITVLNEMIAELEHKPVSATISLDALQGILNAYQTNSNWGRFLNLFCCIFGTHESGTIKALRTLNKVNLTRDDIQTAIDSAENQDSQKARRLGLFETRAYDASGTDSVLQNIINAFGSSP